MLASGYPAKRTVDKVRGSVDNFSGPALMSGFVRSPDFNLGQMFRPFQPLVDQERVYKGWLGYCRPKNARVGRLAELAKMNVRSTKRGLRYAGDVEEETYSPSEAARVLSRSKRRAGARESSSGQYNAYRKLDSLFPTIL